MAAVLGSLRLRDWTDDRERRARFGSALAIVARLLVPLDYCAGCVLASIRPDALTTHGVNAAPSTVLAMLASIGAFLFRAAAGIVIRLRLLAAQDYAHEIQERERTPLDLLWPTALGRWSRECAGAPEPVAPVFRVHRTVHAHVRLAVSDVPERPAAGAGSRFAEG